jgi:hypothetical protein
MGRKSSLRIWAVMDGLASGNIEVAVLDVSIGSEKTRAVEDPGEFRVIRFGVVGGSTEIT